jgi:hypothetical protein
MATPPYAKLLVRRNDGAPETGGIIGEVGDVVALSIENPTGVNQYRWEIYDYPPDFEEPEGWETDSQGVYFSLASTPPTFEITEWGDFLLALYVNDARTTGSMKLSDAHSTAIRVLSPSGLVDLSALEKQQFSLRGWPVGQKQNLRLLGDITLGIVPDSSITPAKLDDNAGAYATYTDVRNALTAGARTAGSTVRTASRATPGDGGDGEWTVVAIGSHVDNGGTVLTGGSFAALRKPTGAVDVRWFGAVGDGISDDTVAIQAAIDWLGETGGGVVSLPSGEILLDSEEINVHEGPAVTLASGVNNIVIRGAGRGATILKPASNRIEMFLQHGGSNITFEDITFDNSANGLLQNQVKPGSLTPGGGVAGAGNSANAAIRQSLGPDLTVRRCDFIEFICSIHYIGDSSDQATLSGVLTVEDTDHDGCTFCVLAEQPREIYMIGKNIDRNTEDSVNSGGGRDAGHLLYVTNRAGAIPHVIQTDILYSVDCASSTLKVRKGESLVFGGVSAHNCGRAIELWGVKKTVGGNITARLAPTPNGSNNSGLEISDCAEAEISNVVIDASGQDAWGVRVRDADSSFSWINRRTRLRNVTVINDFAVTGKAGIIIQDQEDFTLEGYRLINTGTTASTRYPVDVRNCARARIIDPEHVSSGASDAALLVQFDVNCTDGYVRYGASSLNVTPTASTINNLGTNTRVFFETNPSCTNTTANGGNPRLRVAPDTAAQFTSLADAGVRTYDFDPGVNGYYTLAYEFRLITGGGSYRKVSATQDFKRVSGVCSLEGSAVISGLGVQTGVAVAFSIASDDVRVSVTNTTGAALTGHYWRGTLDGDLPT